MGSSDGVPDPMRIWEAASGLVQSQYVLFLKPEYIGALARAMTDAEREWFKSELVFLRDMLGASHELLALAACPDDVGPSRLEQTEAEAEVVLRKAFDGDPRDEPHRILAAFEGAIQDIGPLADGAYGSNEPSVEGIIVRAIRLARSAEEAVGLAAPLCQLPSDELLKKIAVLLDQAAGTYVAHARASLVRAL